MIEHEQGRAEYVKYYNKYNSLLAYKSWKKLQNSGAYLIWTNCDFIPLFRWWYIGKDINSFYQLIIVKGLAVMPRCWNLSVYKWGIFFSK